MVRHGVDTIVFSSSCATYGVPDVLPIAEEALQRPISPYGAFKLMCEQIFACRDHLPPGNSLLRYFNACELIRRVNSASGMIPNSSHTACRLMPHPGRGPRCRFSAQIIRPDGTCERDFIHVPISQELTLRRSTGLTTAVKRWL